MAEYAIVIMWVVSGLVFFLPEFIKAIGLYYKNFYIFLNYPFP